MGHYATTDAHALRLIAEGRILADPATGVILVDGVPRGFNTNGYQRIHAAGVGMMAHRVLWLFVHGSIPDGHVINHRDGNRKNNRIANLEAVTQYQNAHHAMRTANYRGTYPGEDVDSDVAMGAMELARSDDATRDDVLALLGIEPREVVEDAEWLMQSNQGWQMRRANRLA